MADVEAGDSRSPPARWAVWRMDDNGNTLVVREHLEAAEAERLAVEFTARGHKQIYWAKPEKTRATEPIRTV
jgi:UDP-N-acetyl-2-amino-2-deoxyglucuronate dehydrogenase